MARSHNPTPRLGALVVTAALVMLAAACGGTASDRADVRSSDAILAQAYEERAAGLLVEGKGAVVRLLTDDDEGSRHQRFIVRLDSGQTLLVAHNIDVAPPVDDLRAGDAIAFAGVYEWSEEGGTIHWTHLDPDGEHAPGWLRHGGRLYQ